MSFTQNDTETKGPDTVLWMFTATLFLRSRLQVASMLFHSLQLSPQRATGQGLKQNASTLSEAWRR